MTMRIPNTFPPEARKRLWEYLYSHSLSAGTNTPHSTCSIGAVNLALGNGVIDRIPQSMSQVIGSWIINVQDAMPNRLRNSDGWKKALVASVDTMNNPAAEDRRLELILQTMWGKVIPILQPAADKGGYGEEWLMMSKTKSLASIRAAADAIIDIGVPFPGHLYTANAAEEATKTVHDYRVTHRVMLCSDAAERAYHSANATHYASFSAYKTGISDEFWEQVNPVQILTNLTQV